MYVLEANPRSSRTVPFVSKATGVPIAKLAAKVMAGETLASLEASEQIPDHTSIKEVVLPFDRLPGSDPRLGPEMKSTGEVMGTASDFGTAYWKAQQAAYNDVSEGTAVVDFDIDGFENHFEIAEFDDVPQAIREGEVDFVVSRDRDTLEMAVEEEIPYLSTEASATAYVEALDEFNGDLEVAPSVPAHVARPSGAAANSSKSQTEGSSSESLSRRVFWFSRVFCCDFVELSKSADSGR